MIMKQKSSKIIIALIVIIMSLSFFLLSNKNLSLRKNSIKNDTIKIPLHNWSSQIVMAHIIGEIFKSTGNKIEYIPIKPELVYEAIRDGNISLSHEVWETSLGEKYYDIKKEGGFLEWGNHQAKVIQELGYPNWVNKYCPGLPKWEALKNKDCINNFVTDDKTGKGIILEAPISWRGDLIPQRIEALGLSDLWSVKFVIDPKQLWKNTRRAKNKDKGIIIFNWSPNFTDQEGFTFIDFPPYYEGCHPLEGGDGKCGSPVSDLKKIVNKNFPKNHSQAAKIFKKISFNNYQIGTMAFMVDKENMTYEEAAKKWLENNKNLWMSWTK